ncbi:PD40 domain-containing protein [Actinospica robiniae]|uniref:PD40 domain-containing protein n=1 Tax=Actinospica robiniae TaxID=304901 RepID=UPI00146F9B63|nr:PD40 domain-containing protein [Actinospica robiniae]
MINGRTVTFPTTVTDAVWSPNGDRLAFVDAQGNICVSRPDGTEIKVLTPAVSGVTRSGPTWEDGGGEVVYSRTGGDGIAKLYEVAGSGQDVDAHGNPTETQVFETSTDGGRDTAPSAVFDAAETWYSQVAGAGPRSVLVYQHGTASGAEVLITDRNIRNIQGFNKLVTGSQPALAPNGERTAYVDGNGQIDLVSLHGNGPSKPVRLTVGLSGVTHLAWSPDGSTLAFGTSTGVDSIPVPANAVSSSEQPVTQVSATPGVPTYQPLPATVVARISGQDPTALSIAQSQARFTTPKDFGSTMNGPAAFKVYIAPADPTQSEYDLAASLSTDIFSGPVLLTASGHGLDARVSAEIKRLLGTPNPDSFVETSAPQTITIVGGTDGVSAAAERQLRALGYPVVRDDPSNVIAGTPKPEHANGHNVVLADEHDPAAVAIGAAVARLNNAKLMFTDGSTLPPAVAAYLNADTVADPTPGEDYGHAQIDAVGNGATQAIGTWKQVPYTQVTTVTATSAEDLSGKAAALLSDGPLGIDLIRSGNLTDSLSALDQTVYTSDWPLIVDPTSGLAGTEASWLGAQGGSVAEIWVDGSADLPDSVVGQVTSSLGALSTNAVGNPVSSVVSWTPPQ